MASAKKLLERMSRTKSGWNPSDLDTVYLSKGFIKREGANHTVYVHPEFPILRATVARHGELPPGYIEHLLGKMRELEILKEQQEAENENA